MGIYLLYGHSPVDAFFVCTMNVRVCSPRNPALLYCHTGVPLLIIVILLYSYPPTTTVVLRSIWSFGSINERHGLSIVVVTKTRLCSEAIKARRCTPSLRLCSPSVTSRYLELASPLPDCRHAGLGRHHLRILLRCILYRHYYFLFLERFLV